MIIQMEEDKEVDIERNIVGRYIKSLDNQEDIKSFNRASIECKQLQSVVCLHI